MFEIRVLAAQVSLRAARAPRLRSDPPPRISTMLTAREHADLAQLLADCEDFAAFLSGVCLGEPLQLLGDEGAPLAAAGGDDCVSDDEFSTMLTECFGGKEVRCTRNNPGE